MGIISLLGSFMAMQFEAHEDGYVYRANSRGPAIPVTHGEYVRYVRQGGWSFLFHVVAFMLSVVAAAMVTAHWFPDGGEAGGMLLMGGLMIVIAYALYRSVHWAMHAPERELSSRAPVAPARTRPRSATAKADVAQSAAKPGCLTFLAFAFAEVVGGIAAGLLAYALLGAIADAAVPSHADAISMIGALVAGIVTVFLIDRWCVRKTGSSILEAFSAIS